MKPKLTFKTPVRVALAIAWACATGCASPRNPEQLWFAPTSMFSSFVLSDREPPAY